MKRFSMAMFALLTVGCTKSVVDSGWDDSGDADTDSDSDTDTDTDTDVSYFEAVAVGFEYVGGYDRENGELVNLDYNDGNGERLAFVRVTFADTNFFSAQTSEEQEAHQCEVLALFDWGDETTDMECESYDTGASAAPYHTFVGTLSLDENNMYGDNCWAFDPAEFENGTPLTRFDGMKFGVGFGEITEYLWSRYTSEEDQEYVKTYAMASYIGMLHPAGVDNYDFIGYDWTVSYTFEMDDIGIVSVDEENRFTEIESADFKHAFVNSSAYWYEDFPNLDLDHLRDE